MSLTIDKTSGGSKNITTEVVTVSRSDIYYGRKNPKTTIYQVTAGEASATMTVTEEAMGWYNTLTSDVTISNNSTSYIVSGYSNAQYIDFNLVGLDNYLNSHLIKFLVNNVEVEFSKDDTYDFYSITIPNDIGASDKYYWEAHFSCDINTTISSRGIEWECYFNADELDGEGESGWITITQSAGNAYIYWSLTSGQEDTSAEATMPQDGGVVQTYVMSNTSWTITQE